jgi:hypothetical protein
MVESADGWLKTQKKAIEVGWGAQNLFAPGDTKYGTSTG